MAQVYKFVDDNGITRLFAEIQPDPAGTPFNGGTITNALEIDGSSDAIQLIVKAFAGQGSLLAALQDSLGSVVVSIGTDGNATFNGQLQAGPTAGSATQLFIDGSNNTIHDVIQGKGSGGRRGGVNAEGALFTDLNAAPADAELFLNGRLLEWYDSTAGASKLMVKAKDAAGTIVAPGLTGRDLATAPAVSAASTLALGTAYQNTLGYDVMLCVYLSVTVNTSGVLKLGVGPTTTPTQQTLVTGITSTGLWPVPIYLPSTYYALLSVTGTITVAVDGQIAMPV